MVGECGARGRGLWVDESGGSEPLAGQSIAGKHHESHARLFGAGCDGSPLSRGVEPLRKALEADDSASACDSLTE